MASVSAADSTAYAAKPEANRRCSRGNPRRDLVIGIRRQLHRQRADKGPLAIPFRPFGCQPGIAHLVVGLDFQRSAFGDPSRPGACRLRQTEFTALRILDLLRPRHASQSNTLVAERPNGAGRNGRSWPLARSGKICSVANGMSQCSATLAAVVLEIHAGEQQVGPVRQRRQRRADLRPALGKGSESFAPTTCSAPGSSRGWRTNPPRSRDAGPGWPSNPVRRPPPQARPPRRS